jgi:hypothetical protein
MYYCSTCAASSKPDGSAILRHDNSSGNSLFSSFFLALLIPVLLGVQENLK